MAAPEPFKHWFNEARYTLIADAVARLAPRFDRKRFLELTLGGLAERELMDRLRQTAIALGATLPGSYRQQLATVLRLAPEMGHSFVGVSLCDFVARFGLDEPEISLDALRQLTRHGSAEFAVRPFLMRDQARTLAVMETWARDPDEQVRRLASEGSRPRLPWGLRLAALVRDPSPVAPILETLKADPSLYVRKSVANHLNDITKDHPGWVIERVTAWDRSAAGTGWIVRHALRSLVKKGHPPALALLGVGGKPQLEIEHFAAAPRRLTLGEPLSLTATLRSTTRKTQRLAVDYVVHYVKASGGTSAKVFKWKVLSLAAGETAVLTKRQTVRDFTTRRHHPGMHRITLQINGRRLAETRFILQR
ncbi:MAG TPA: DNA alkylation repair protein [Opitutaceae bacterium]|nr:DNA alkylation repair protein [Opitutaceae bacterium]